MLKRLKTLCLPVLMVTLSLSLGACKKEDLAKVKTDSEPRGDRDSGSSNNAGNNASNASNASGDSTNNSSNSVPPEISYNLDHLDGLWEDKDGNWIYFSQDRTGSSGTADCSYDFEISEKWSKDQYIFQDITHAEKRGSKPCYEKGAGRQCEFRIELADDPNDDQLVLNCVGSSEEERRYDYFGY